ncbi:MAG: ribosome-associated translation inhibitor RaiA [Rhodospirillaceae bacterium]|nr:ribosome-associated translation inhibitor RaiA [Rhodospirillaceae bacterium]
MQVPVQISFHGCDHSDVLSKDIADHAIKIEEYYGRITSCRVVVEAPHKSHTKGKLFHINIEISIPGVGQAIHNDRGNNPAHEDVYVAVRDAFKAIESQIKTMVGKRRDEERRENNKELSA